MDCKFWTISGIESKHVFKILYMPILSAIEAFFDCVWIFENKVTDFYGLAVYPKMRLFTVWTFMSNYVFLRFGHTRIKVTFIKKAKFNNLSLPARVSGLLIVWAICPYLFPDVFSDIVVYGIHEKTVSARSTRFKTNWSPLHHIVWHCWHWNHIKQLITWM